MVQRKRIVPSRLYLRYIYTVIKVGYIHIKSVIPVTCITGKSSPALSAADIGIAINSGAAIAREIADVTIKADSLEELVALKAIANSLQKRVHANYRFVLTFNSALIALGALGILQPASSAMLHNLSTIGISLKSMTNLLPENKAPQLKA